MLLKKGVRVEVKGGHFDLPVGPVPIRACAIPVQLHPVTFGIGEVEGLTHQVVGAPGETVRSAGGDRRDREGQMFLRVEQNRRVEEAGRTVRCLREGRLVLQNEQGHLASPEGNPISLCRKNVQADCVAVPVGHRIEVADQKCH